CGTPATRQVVDELASPRIRYLRSERPLSMSANWELVVSRARGEYVMLLGDDDGLLPHALRELDRLIVTWGNPRAVRWTGAFYTSPPVALPGQGNSLRLPLGREVRVIDGRAAIADAIAFRGCYSRLPMVNNSAIQRSLLAELRGRTGRVFGNHYP